MSDPHAEHGSESLADLLRGAVMPLGVAAVLTAVLLALSSDTGSGPQVGAFGLRFGAEFVIFGVTLFGIAMRHAQALQIAASGALATMVFKLLTREEFHMGEHLAHEWVILVNLFGLLIGFGLLAYHFETSGVPERLPRLLPKGMTGAFALLALVFVMSGFLDNIAAAIIGGSVAATVFKGRVHIGYLAGLVAASNAGGAGSVLGDTTTTMMWIEGHSPMTVLPAYLGAFVTLLVSGIPSAWLQARYQPIQEVEVDTPLDKMRIVCVAAILFAVVATNVVQNTVFHKLKLEEHYPMLAIAVWVAIVLLIPLRAPDWKLIPPSVKGSSFLVLLVLTASMMPLDQLPSPGVNTTFAIGAVSSIFDNIPLTALALKQGGYDWALLAFAVGYGGSMVWFGSSAGVALSNRFPQVRSTLQWLRHGWHIPLAYVAGFWVMALVTGWHPDDIDGHHGHGDESSHEAPEEPGHLTQDPHDAVGVGLQPASLDLELGAHAVEAHGRGH
jgi:Na+/H+ antiporter NhaD/arsenite permease-like protein